MTISLNTNNRRKRTVIIRDAQGKYVCKKNYLKFFAFLLTVLTVTFGLVQARQTARTVKPQGTSQVKTNAAVLPCIKIQEATSSTPAYYDCNSEPTATKKWQRFIEQEYEHQIMRLKKKLGDPDTILSYVCREEGIGESQCPKILRAMAMQESAFGKLMQGDGGRSRGWFHILDIHKDVSEGCKYDLECSARWTLKRMIRYGYLSNPDRAIRAHNGSGKQTFIYLAQVKAKMQ